MALETGSGASALEPEPNLLVACALRKEASTLGRLLPGLSIFPTGFGARRTKKALETLLSQRPFTRLLLFTGAAGALDPTVRMGEVICPESWRTADGARLQLSAHLLSELRLGGWEATGAALTVSRPALRAATRRRIFQETGARICDMEAAEALRTAERHGVPALAVKVVTDTEDSSVFAFWSSFDQNMKLLAERLACLWPTLVGFVRREGQ